MRTTDPKQAITSLLASASPDAVISYDGTLYHVRDMSKTPDKGSKPILRKALLDVAGIDAEQAVLWLGNIVASRAVRATSND